MVEIFRVLAALAFAWAMFYDAAPIQLGHLSAIDARLVLILATISLYDTARSIEVGRLKDRISALENE